MVTKKAKKTARKDSRWHPFDRANYYLFLAGAATIVLGYLSLMQGPHDSFLSLRLAPLLLVVGYCVLLPIAILKRPRAPKTE